LIKVVFLGLALAVLLLLVTFIRTAAVDTGPVSGQGRSFFEQFVIAGGPIVWIVLLPISVVMVYLAADYSFSITRKRLVPADIAKKITEKLKGSGIEQLQQQLAGGGDFVSSAVEKALRQGRGDWFRMRSVVAESLQEQAGVLFRRIEWINLIGSVSPMVGLFGTVFGMIKLFNSIVAAGGQPQPSQLADGISVALVTTFWGLVTAIPAISVYGIFSNRIEALAGDAVAEAEAVMSEIREIIQKRQRGELTKQAKQKAYIKEVPAKKGCEQAGRDVSISETRGT